MKKEIIYICFGILFLTAGTYLSKQSSRAPASYGQSSQKLGLVYANQSTRKAPDASLSLPKIEARKTPDLDLKRVEDSLTRKMASDDRYTKVFVPEDLSKVSACAISKAHTQIGIDRFKLEIAQPETDGFNIFNFCMVNIHSQRVAFNQAQKKATLASQNAVAAPKAKAAQSPNLEEVATHESADDSAANENLATAEVDTKTTSSMPEGTVCDDTGCYASNENDPNFVGPPSSAANKQKSPNESPDESTLGSTGVNDGVSSATPFGNGLGI